MIAVAKRWAQSVDKDGGVSVALASGEALSGKLHEQFSAGVRILGRTWDLEAACKQFAVLPAHRFASIIAVEGPGKRDRTFWIGDALPFGARASVHSFNRPALALRRLALTQLGAVATNYFDD